MRPAPDPLLGFIATIFAVFLAYLRAQGKVAGAHQEFCGPMAKQQRMAAVTIASVVCAILSLMAAAAGDRGYRIPEWTLWLIIGGCNHYRDSPIAPHCLGFAQALI